MGVDEDRTAAGERYGRDTQKLDRKDRKTFFCP